MKKLFAFGMAAAMTLSLAACGGAASSAAPSEAASEASSEAASSEAAAESSDATGKTWVIATDTVFKPFEYTDASGNFVGIDVDIVAAIAEDQGFDYEMKSLGWDAAIAACQAGQADGMIAGASITDERKASGWTFSDGYYDATQTMTVAEDSDITGFADLNGQTVAVKTGTQGATYAESLKDEYGFNITYFEDSPTMYQAVLGGQCVACFEDTPIMKASIKDGGLALKVLDDTASDPAPYGFAIFSADSQELLDMFNAGLADIKANGKYDEILAKYLGSDLCHKQLNQVCAGTPVFAGGPRIFAIGKRSVLPLGQNHYQLWRTAAGGNGANPAAGAVRSVLCLYSGLGVRHFKRAEKPGLQHYCHRVCGYHPRCANDRVGVLCIFCRADAAEQYPAPEYDAGHERADHLLGTTGGHHLPGAELRRLYGRDHPCRY